MLQKVKLLLQLRDDVRVLENQLVADLGLITVTSPDAAPVRGYAVKITTPPAPRPKKSRRRHRLAVTADTRLTVKKMSEAGKTVAEIAKATGNAGSTIQNLKKQLGLVKKK